MNIQEACSQVLEQIREIPTKFDSAVEKIPRLTEEQSMYLFLFVLGTLSGFIIGFGLR